MNLQLLSDLHLETDPAFEPQPAPGADLLVLAGDIGSYQGGSKLPGTDFGLDRFAAWPVPVLYVPGNHEYDGLDLDATRLRLQEVCARHGLVWLDERVWHHRGVRFVGTTLWADYDALTPQAQRVAAAGAEGRLPDARRKAFGAANHHLRRAAIQRDGLPWLAQQMREESLRCQAWLQAVLECPADGPTVVVTHFAPTLHSADPRYGRSPGTAGFCNARDDLLAHVDLWLHGHLHCATDQQVGRCRIWANPRGYAHKGEQAGFDPLRLCRVVAGPTRPSD